MTFKPADGKNHEANDLPHARRARRINGTTGAVDVASGGTLSPGASAGKLTVGSLSLVAGATLKIELGGVTAGTGYDQLDVNGTVALGGATLNLSLIGGFVPSSGANFVIIDNDGADAVSGSFAGLAEGAILTVGGTQFQDQLPRRRRQRRGPRRCPNGARRTAFPPRSISRPMSQQR